jgi:hypothetical protein
MRFVEIVKCKGQDHLLGFSMIPVVDQDCCCHVTVLSPLPKVSFYMYKRNGSWKIERYLLPHRLLCIEEHLHDIIEKEAARRKEEAAMSW